MFPSFDHQPEVLSSLVSLENVQGQSLLKMTFRTAKQCLKIWVYLTTPLTFSLSLRQPFDRYVTDEQELCLYVRSDQPTKYFQVMIFSSTIYIECLQNFLELLRMAENCILNWVCFGLFCPNRHQWTMPTSGWHIYSSLRAALRTENKGNMNLSLGPEERPEERFLLDVWKSDASSQV